MSQLYNTCSRMATTSRYFVEGWKPGGDCGLYVRMRSTSSVGIQANESLPWEIQRMMISTRWLITDLLVKDKLAYLR